MEFSSHFKEVSRRLKQTAEMVALRQGNVALPINEIFDFEPWIAGLRSPGSFLPAPSLFKLARMIEALEDTGKFFSESIQGSVNIPELSSLFGQLTGFPQVASEIFRCVDRFGEVKDSASEELYSIRRSIKAATGSVQATMRAVLERAKNSQLVDRDAKPSMRDGRMVIALPAEKKRQIAGIIHDESASGKTVFIEPAEVVEASNRLRELHADELREVVRILTLVADEIRPELDEIAHQLRFLYILDFIRAKAHLAEITGGELPVMESEPEIDWYAARHPVLMMALKKHGKEVVPMNIHLDRKTRILIISGPNAGGKSVCLKTVGIVQYMAQCGLLPSLYSNSHMGVFENMFADIGDEQSLENDLSTYSSHLKNMKVFINNASPRSLLLADEMGSGTEPLIGGALAQAMLQNFGEKGCFGVVTTHYQNLKSFADETPGFVNGAMLYDRQLLQPTFQLSVGSPGSSFALEIATKTGLPSSVIEAAKEIVGSDYVNTDRYLLDIARDRKYWNNKRQNIREKEHKLDALLESYEQKSSELKRQRSEIINQARHEAREVLKEANARIEKTIRDIKTAEAEKQRTRQIRQSLEDYKREVNDSQREDDASKLPEVLKDQRHKSKASRQKNKTAEIKPNSKDLPQVGDYVKMQEGGVAGKVLAISGKRAEVAFGALRTFVELAKLKVVDKPKQSALQKSVASLSQSTADESRNRQLNFKQEIDVRGFRADEALQAVNYFLDDAIQFGARRLRILHGTGHGILKTLIRQLLSANPAVSSFSDEDVRFGGAGITVVNLD